MTNIPTDLLRTLVAVVDLRSFTKAAASLGVTQPAVSAQIKRLQFLLGGELFDRSSQGISLTPQGEMVVSYARRLLSINDQIVHLGEAGPRPELVIRVGTPSDFIASILPNILARFRERWPDVRFIVRTDFHDSLLRDLRSGEVDLYVGLSMSQPPDARHSWAEEVVWVRGAASQLDIDRPVPLVSHGERSVYHRLAVTALKAAGLEWEDVFTGPSMNSLNGAVAAGLGVMAVTRRRANDVGMLIWDDAPLPKLPDLYSGIYVREGGARAAYEQLADEIAEAISAARPGARKIVGVADKALKTDSAA
ncbi:MAG: LysR family transcriptional regulator [Rhizobiales bacterium]|nr:LysR family transcriptional regulator [Hyphomicrobiales bacterium]